MWVLGTCLGIPGVASNPHMTVALAPCVATGRSLVGSAWAWPIRSHRNCYLGGSLPSLSWKQTPRKDLLLVSSWIMTINSFLTTQIFKRTEEHLEISPSGPTWYHFSSQDTQRTSMPALKEASGIKQREQVEASPTKHSDAAKKSKHQPTSGEGRFLKAEFRRAWFGAISPRKALLPALPVSTLEPITAQCPLIYWCYSQTFCGRIPSIYIFLPRDKTVRFDFFKVTSEANAFENKE